MGKTQCLQQRYGSVQTLTAAIWKASAIECIEFYAPNRNLYKWRNVVTPAQHKHLEYISGERRHFLRVLKKSIIHICPRVVFRPAFRFCTHLKAGRNTFLVKNHRKITVKCLNLTKKVENGKKFFKQHSGVRSTWKLVEIHNTPEIINGCGLTQE